MANTYNSFPASAIGTGTTVLRSAVPAAETDIVFSLLATNDTSSNVTFSCWFTRSAVNYYICRNAPIPAGSTLKAIGADSRVVLLTGDVLNVQSSAASSVDVIASVLQIT